MVVNKLPSCDQCKASKTRCLATRDARNQCPRCVDKQILCTTTPLKRGRPKKVTEAVASNRASSSSQTPPPAVGETSTPDSDTNQGDILVQQLNSHAFAPHAVARRAQADPSADLNLTTAAIQNGIIIELFDTFYDLPQATTVALPLQTLYNHLRAAPLSQITPSQSVLLHAILAVGALASPAVASAPRTMTLSRTPSSLLDSVDLRSFGRGRMAICEVMKNKAFQLAKDEGVITDCSEDNCATLSLLSFLDSRQRDKSNNSRPYAVAFLQQVRTLAEEAGSLVPSAQEGIHWAAELAIEAVSAAVDGKPVPVTTQDVLSLCGNLDGNLAAAVDRMRTDWTSTGASIFGCIAPYSFELIRLSKDSYRLFTSKISQSRHLDYPALLSFLSSLETLKSALDAIVAQSALIFFAAETINRLYYANMQQLLYHFSLLWSSLYLPMHREILRRRASFFSSIPGISELGIVSDEDTPLFAQAELLVKQSTVRAAKHVSECVRDVYSLNLLTHAPLDRSHEWTQILLQEWETGKGMGLDLCPNLRWMVSGLKLLGWANVDLDDTIELAERQLAEEEKYKRQPSGMDEVMGVVAGAAELPAWSWS